MLMSGLVVSHLRAVIGSFLLSTARWISVRAAGRFRARPALSVAADRPDVRPWQWCWHGRVAPLKTRTPRTT
jgi:hypothetical protein